MHFVVLQFPASNCDRHDIVVLDENEQEQAKEMQSTIKKMERLTLMAKRFGLASLALLVINGAIVVYSAIREAYGSAVQY